MLPQGQKIHVRGADDADVGRGFNLAGAWLDEIAKWRWSFEGWYEGVLPSLRVKFPGGKPRACVTTTPKPVKILKEWAKEDDGSVVITRGSMWDNAKNLSKDALAALRKRYEGTRLGRQELEGELLEDIEGALWFWSMIENHRVSRLPDDIVRRVTALDGAVTYTEDSDETGIITVSMDSKGELYVEGDASIQGLPDSWAQTVVSEYERLMSDRVVVETNQGGAMWRQVLHTIMPGLPIQEVVASQGKKIRAEPVSALYEQGKVHHVGSFPELESQMIEWVPGEGDSPDRVDALVWAVHALAFKRHVNEVQSFDT